MPRTSRVERLRREHKIPPVETVEDKLAARPRKKVSRADRLGVTAIAAVDDQAGGALHRFPLAALARSPLNVRQTDPAEAVEELAADIHEHGLLKNLVGLWPAALSGPIEIIAGGRRLEALQLLVSQAKLQPDHLVDVRIVDRDQAREISLSENIHRVALNPADEYESFARIVADHPNDPDPIALCARRQGVTRRRVEQALRLANLAPAILEALRGGEITVDAARTYAGVSDHELQLTVFRGELDRTVGQRHQPQNIRFYLQGRTYPASIVQARYVGLDAYVAAGGRIERDLFMGAEEGEQLLDRAILDRLVQEKATAELPRRVERDGFADGVLMKTFTAIPAWPAPPAGYRLDGRATDPANMSMLPAFDVRPTAIGIYTIGAGALRCVGWFVPVAPPPASAEAPSPLASAAAREQRAVESARAYEAISGQPSPARVDRAREARLKLTAAREAIRTLDPDTALERAIWPARQDYVPALTTAIGDDDTFLLAVQIRVTRAELDAALPAAQQLLGDEEPAHG